MTPAVQMVIAAVSSRTAQDIRMESMASWILLLSVDDRGDGERWGVDGRR